MKISITQPAAKWYINVLDLQKGDFVRFFVRYGGFGGIHRGFSLGVAKDQPNNPSIQIEALGVTYYVESSDSWYFDDYNFHIKYSRKYDEIQYQFT